MNSEFSNLLEFSENNYSKQILYNQRINHSLLYRLGPQMSDDELRDPGGGTSTQTSTHSGEGDLIQFDQEIHQGQQQLRPRVPQPGIMDDSILTLGPRVPSDEQHVTGILTGVSNLAISQGHPNISQLEPTRIENLGSDREEDFREASNHQHRNISKDLDLCGLSAQEVDHEINKLDKVLIDGLNNASYWHLIKVDEYENRFVHVHPDIILHKDAAQISSNTFHNITRDAFALHLENYGFICAALFHEYLQYVDAQILAKQPLSPLECFEILKKLGQYSRMIESFQTRIREFSALLQSCEAPWPLDSLDHYESCYQTIEALMSSIETLRSDCIEYRKKYVKPSDPKKERRRAGTFDPVPQKSHNHSLLDDPNPQLQTPVMKQGSIPPSMAPIGKRVRLSVSAIRIADLKDKYDEYSKEQLKTQDAKYRDELAKAKTAIIEEIREHEKNGRKSGSKQDRKFERRSQTNH